MEYRKLNTGFVEVPEIQAILAQPQIRSKDNLFCLTLVIWGCLALFGIRLSTVSAHFVSDSRLSTTADWIAVPPLWQRRGRRLGRRSNERSNTTVCASYSRYSSDNQSGLSIPDQRRKCQEWAEREGLQIDSRYEYADEAVSGTKLHRNGLDKLIEDAQAGCFNVLVFEHVSRLARELVISLPLLKDLVFNHNIRIVSVTEGIDSLNPNWETLVTVTGMQSGEYLRYLSASVFRGQEGNVHRDFSNGDWCFGYRSEPIPGSEFGRGQNIKMRKRVVIDPVTSKWVRQVFEWYVREQRSIRWIARELNRVGAPKDHRSSTKVWRPELVRSLLLNQKYIGDWSWGKLQNRRNPLTGKVRQIERTNDETTKWLKHRDELKLIDLSVFEVANKRLADNEAELTASRRADGRIAGPSRGGKQIRHLLQSLFLCGQCGGTFKVTGASGKYLGCTGFINGTCSVRTQLLRATAERVLLSEIGRLIHVDPAWKEVVDAEVQSAWTQRIKLGGELSATEHELAAVDVKIRRLVDRVEAGDENVEISERLAQRRSERSHLLRRHDELCRLDNSPQSPPTSSWVADQLSNLFEIVSNGGPAAAEALRALVGGHVEITEVSRPGRKRKGYRGRFRLNARRWTEAFNSTPGQSGMADQSGREQWVELDFVEPPSWAALADQVKELTDAGTDYETIAELLSCPKGWVSKARAFWFGLKGEQPPDGRKQPRSNGPTLSEQYAVQVMALWEQGMHLHAIAERLGIHRKHVTAAVQKWHTAQGIPVLDGRARRRNLGIG